MSTSYHAAILDHLLDHIRSPSDAFIRRKYVGINTSVVEEKNTNMASADDSSGIPLLSAPVPPRGNDGQRPIQQSPDSRNRQTQARRVDDAPCL